MNAKLRRMRVQKKNNIGLTVISRGVGDDLVLYLLSLQKSNLTCPPGGREADGAVRQRAAGDTRRSCLGTWKVTSAREDAHAAGIHMYTCGEKKSSKTARLGLCLK